MVGTTSLTPLETYVDVSFHRLVWNIWLDQVPLSESSSCQTPSGCFVSSCVNSTARCLNRFARISKSSSSVSKPGFLFSVVCVYLTGWFKTCSHTPHSLVYLLSHILPPGPPGFCHSTSDCCFPHHLLRRLAGVTTHVALTLPSHRRLASDCGHFFRGGLTGCCSLIASV